MTKDDVRMLIRGLEAGTWPLERWRHDEHLAMATWYLTYLPRRQALRVICDRIKIYDQKKRIPETNKAGYHETVTLFLARGVAAFLDALPEDVSFDTRLSLVRRAFRNYRAALRQYYTRSAIESAAARARFVEADRGSTETWLRACEELAATSEEVATHAGARPIAPNAQGYSRRHTRARAA